MADALILLEYSCVLLYLLYGPSDRPGSTVSNIHTLVGAISKGHGSYMIVSLQVVRWRITYEMAATPLITTVLVILVVP